MLYKNKVFQNVANYNWGILYTINKSFLREKASALDPINNSSMFFL